ncbi:MAG: hypothetical protein V3V22_04525 [Methylococcales bacterium]
MKYHNTKLAGFLIYFIIVFSFVQYAYNLEPYERLMAHLWTLTVLVLLFILLVRKKIISTRKSTIALIGMSFLMLILIIVLDVVYYKKDDTTREQRESMQYNDNKIKKLYHSVKFYKKDYKKLSHQEIIARANNNLNLAKETKFTGHLSLKWRGIHLKLNKQLEHHQNELNNAQSELKIIQDRTQAFHADFPLDQRVCVEVDRADLLSDQKGYCGTIINHNLSSEKVQIKITSVDCSGLVTDVCKGNTCSAWKDVAVDANKSDVIGTGDSVWVSEWCIDLI